MHRLALPILVVVLCATLGLTQSTPVAEILDEPQLLDMFSDSSSAPLLPTGGAHIQESQLPTVTSQPQPLYDRLRGEKTIMVIRIDTLDGNSDYCNEQCAWKLMFGPELQFNHQPTLDAATREASYGLMWFNQSKSVVVTVKLPEKKFALPCHFNQVGKPARELVKRLHAKDPDAYDFVYHFLPNNMRCNFGGVAYLHGKHAYSAPGYTRNGIIKHEVGHNYGLHHARALGGPFGSPGKEDGWDTGSSMGGGVIFGTAERYMLGWISGDAVQDLGEIRAVNGGDSELPGNPKLMAYWDRGSCGPKGDDFNWGWCGGSRGNCAKSRSVGKDICQSSTAKLQSMRSPFKHQGCEFFWFAQYECTDMTGTTTTTTTSTTTVPDGAQDVLLRIAAARHSLNTPYGPHTVLFSLWKDAVFAISYRTPHGTDGASFKVNPSRFGWVVDHKVNVHRLRGGRRQGRGIDAEVLYAGVAAGERFLLDKSPVSHRGNFTLEVCSADENQAVVSLLFHADSTRPSKCPVSSTTSTAPSTTTTTTVLTTTITLAPTTTTTLETSSSSRASTTVITTTLSTSSVMGVQSGDTIFLKTRSGNGHHIDVEGSEVRARWHSQGNFQAIVIEKQNGGAVHSGDTVYLKTYSGKYIHVMDKTVKAMKKDWGPWQALVIEKRAGEGAILPGDLVCFKGHTSNHLDVEDDVVRARWQDCGEWQAMLVQKEAVGALFAGSSIHLFAHTGKLLEVEGDAVQARWQDAGLWQTLAIESYGGRAIFDGDAVFLKAHTGNYVHVQEAAVQARWKDWGDWQRLVIERKAGKGPVMPGDIIFLRTHTGKRIEVEGTAVQARWYEQGTWQELIIEKAASRRLLKTSVDDSSLGGIHGMVMV